MNATARIWLEAVRPRTLAAGLVPVMVGTALAYGNGLARPVPALAALVGALLIQVGTNLANDYYDFVRGADNDDRIGPRRVTQQGLIAPRRVLWAAGLSFGGALGVGLYLVAVAGWPILVVGVTSIAAGYAYTGGPFPLAYHGLGDLFVFVFFGLVAVVGTYFVQALSFQPQAAVVAIPVGALGVALLSVNNLRDIHTDAKAGKRTLVVRLGVRFGRMEYLMMLMVAYATPLAMWLKGTGGWVLLPLLSSPLALPPLRTVWGRTGAALNQALAQTARLQLAFGALFALAIAWGRR